MRKNIALVDDDRNILTSVSMLLEAEGFQIKTYNDGASALEGAERSRRPTSAIFDIKMPRMDGMELLQPHPQDAAVPGDLPHLQGRGDRRGAGPAHGRRRFHHASRSRSACCSSASAPCCAAPTAARAKGEAAAERIVRGELVLDPSRHQCTWKGKEVHLTVTEFLLLKSLAERPGHVKNRDQLMDAAYGETIYVDDRTIDSHIKRVRTQVPRGRRRVRADRNALWHRIPIPRRLSPDEGSDCRVCGHGSPRRWGTATSCRRAPPRPRRRRCCAAGAARRAAIRRSPAASCC